MKAKLLMQLHTELQAHTFHAEMTHNFRGDYSVLVHLDLGVLYF